MSEVDGGNERTFLGQATDVDWSDWGTCTKECERGVHTRTQDIVTKPENGGSSCDNVQEPRLRNTGYCDRDRTMEDLTS